MTKPRRARRNKWLAVLLILIVAGGAAAYYNRSALALWGFDTFLSGSVEKKLEKSYKPIEGRKPVEVAYKKEQPFSLLLLGVDQRDKEIGRSDTMIYTVVRPIDGAMLMVSIPRDTYVDIVGKRTKAGRQWKDKITHAYAFGGAKMSVETVEKLFGEPVGHYATINFKGFRDVIDAMGGIPLPITKDLVNDDADHEKFVVKAGKDVYNGTEALNYVRYREDAGGDTSRAGRHQVFLNAIMNKASSVGQWTKIPQMMDIMGGNFSTDLTPEHMIDLAKSMLQSDNRTIYSHTLKGNGHRKVAHGAWYYFADEEDLATTKALITAWLDPSKTKAELPLPEEAQTKPNVQKPVESLSAKPADTSAKQ
ncbi:LCP family protein [Paenibacillus sacheonensis]|uniref:LytR family transcriptional regulator n=1 Tax=Paenibacillus sacheonensis TaxID=742054 RepID=A0A7X5BXS0_9BACL|nr:LCP family protein [Paenibacillus sacheonensis]MBM7567918.1 LCP family protein required for cell wall assembly [Paenibacillus sacheonensis]NBC70803.1 LytR family transcriptional regulator [Paenibacillus sacheonensis]